MEKEKNKSFIKVFLITFISALVVIGIVMGIVILGDNSQKQNNKQSDTTISQNEDLEQNEKENIKVNENIKYSADSYIGMGLKDMYIVFNDNNFMINLQTNLENEQCVVYMVGNYIQNESNITLNYVNARVELNNIEMKQSEVKETYKSIFNEIFGNGGTISNNGKTITFSAHDEQLEFNAKEEKVAFDIANSILKGNTNIDTEKEYYDFIDPQYGTFNITEDEFVRRIMSITGGNSSYQMQGYERTKATIPNQYNYAKIIGGNIQTMSIVSNPTNGKVSSIKISVIGTKYTEEQANENLYYMISNIVGAIVNYVDLNDMEKKEEGKLVVEEILNEIAPQKGLQTTTDYGDSGISSEIKVIKK